MPEVVVVPALFGDKPIMRRLRQLYLYDFTEFNGDNLPEHGEFHDRYFDLYWNQTN